MTSTLTTRPSNLVNNDAAISRLDYAVIIDECPLFRRGIAAAMADIGVTIVGQSDSGGNGLHVLQLEVAGLLIVGSQLDVSTTVTIRRAKAMNHRPVVMALLARTDEQDLQTLRELGTEALLTRQVQVAELQLAFQHLKRGERFVAAAPLAMIVGSVGSDDSRGNHSLTKREIEIVRRLGEGYSNNAIADALVVSIPTVKTHLSHIYDKLGVRNRRDAVARAMQIGLLA